jgi:hypothetical protein
VPSSAQDVRDKRAVTLERLQAAIEGLLASSPGLAQTDQVLGWPSLALAHALPRRRPAPWPLLRGRAARRC